MQGLHIGGTACRRPNADFQKRSPADGTPCRAVRIRTSARPARGSQWILSRFSVLREGAATFRTWPFASFRCHAAILPLSERSGHQLRQVTVPNFMSTCAGNRAVAALSVTGRHGLLQQDNPRGWAARTTPPIYFACADVSSSPSCRNRDHARRQRAQDRRKSGQQTWTTTKSRTSARKPTGWKTANARSGMA